MFKEKASKDKYVKTFLAKIEKGTYSIDYQKYIEEVKSIHAGRMIHILATKDLLGSQKAILDCIVENQQKRSRLVTIKTECVRKENILLEKISTLTKYIKANFNHQLTLEYSTQQARNTAVESLFSDAEEQIIRMQSLTKIIDIILVDIDQAGWATRNIVEVLKISSNKLSEV